MPSYTLAEAAAAPSDFAECLVARLATGLNSADREPFRLAAESALATLPPQSLGDGAVYRTVEPIWRLIFYPAAMRRDGMGRRREETGQQAHRRRPAALTRGQPRCRYPRERGAHGCATNGTQGAEKLIATKLREADERMSLPGAPPLVASPLAGG